MLFQIIMVIVGIFVLYLVISTAVKDGINKSIVGQSFDVEQPSKKRSFLDGDFDNE